MFSFRQYSGGQDPEAVAVEALFQDEHGLSYIVRALGPDPQTAVAAAEDEAVRYLDADSATDWRPA